MSAALSFRFPGKQAGLAVGCPALLGLAHKAGTAVQVYAPGSGGAVRFVVGDVAFEAVGANAAAGRVGPGHAQHVA